MMIVAPGDGKPDNYNISQIPGRKNTRLLCFDNEYAFGPSVARNKTNNKIYRQVKTVLFSLDQMTLSLPKTVRDFFLGLTLDMISHWLNDLSKENTCYCQLFEDIAKKLWKNYNCFIGIPFARGMIQRLCDRLLRFQEILEKNRNNDQLTLLDVLIKLDPIIGRAYKRGFERPNTIHERFTITDRNLYGTTPSGSPLSTQGVREVLASDQIPIEETVIDAIRHEQNVGPAVALEELMAIKEQSKTKNPGTVLALLRSLRLLSQKSALLKKIDFARKKDNGELVIPQNEQRQILEELAKPELAWQELTLKNAHELNSDWLNRFNLISLRKLSLSGCEGITENNLRAIAQECIWLKYLNISRSKISSLVGTNTIAGILSFSTPALVFSSLEQLLVNNCTQLHTIHVQAQYLKSLRASNCPALKSLSLVCPNLYLLDISNNSLITDSELNKAIRSSSDLKKLHIQGCQKISEQEVRTLCPIYRIALLKNISPHTKELILKVLTHDPLLKTLHLGVKQTSEADFIAIAEALKTNQSVTELHLGINGIGDEGIKSLARTLERNNTLTSVHLGDTTATDAGIAVLAKALESNNTVQQLCLFESPAEQILKSLQTQLANLASYNLPPQTERLLREKLKNGINEVKEVIASNAQSTDQK